MSRSYRIWILPIIALGGGGCGPPPPPCDGTWGPIVDPDAAVHVREDGDDAGLGTHDDPLATVAAAVDATRTGPLSRIALGLVIKMLVIVELFGQEPEVFAQRSQLIVDFHDLAFNAAHDEDTISAPERR